MTLEHTKQSTIKIEKFTLFNRTLEIEVGINGNRIPILERLADRQHYVGPPNFPYVVNLGDLISGSGMRASRVSDAEMWSPAKSLPRGVRILEFGNTGVQTHLDEISNLAMHGDWKNLTHASLYYTHGHSVYEAIIKETGINPKDTVFLSLLRAGGVAGKMLGIPFEEQVLIETKRLRLEDGNGGNIAIGIDYRNPEDLKRLEGKHWLIADPAGATFASVLANIILLTHQGIHPSRVSIWNIAASQKGIEFALKAMNQLGVSGEIVTGGYAPAMNEKYYLVRADGNPSVGDAGDWLSRFLDLDSVIVPKT